MSNRQQIIENPSGPLINFSEPFHNFVFTLFRTSTYDPRTFPLEYPNINNTYEILFMEPHVWNRSICRTGEFIV